MKNKLCILHSPLGRSYLKTCVDIITTLSNRHFMCFVPGHYLIELNANQLKNKIIEYSPTFSLIVFKK